MALRPYIKAVEQLVEFPAAHRHRVAVAIRGQIKRCCSRRFDHSTKPLRSQYKIRIRSRRDY